MRILPRRQHTDTTRISPYCDEVLREEGLSLLLGYNAKAHHHPATFVTNRGQELLDITVGNTLKNILVKHWRVSEKPSMSDHRMILFDIEGNSEVSK